MIKKIKLIGLPILLSLIVLGGCGKAAHNSQLEILRAEKDKNIETLLADNKKMITNNIALEEKIEELEDELLEALDRPTPAPGLLGPSSNLLATSLEVIELIKDKDMVALSDYVHFTKGLRFTPYFYIDTQKDQVFTASEVAVLDQNSDLFTWGEYDGIGDPIHLNFNDYYDLFIYDKDFMNPQMIGNNTSIGSGNTLDNMDDAYPNSHFIEFHFSGINPQYEGMDWGSLKLVFEESEGVWYLVGVVHGQWTI